MQRKQNISSLQDTVSKIIPKKIPFFTNNVKNSNFDMLFMIFFRNRTPQRAEVFCVACKVQNGKPKLFWNQKGKPHTMTHGKDRLSMFGRKFNLPSMGKFTVELFT